MGYRKNMKDVKHHLKHVLKKVIRKARKNPDVQEHLDKQQLTDGDKEQEKELQPVETYRWYGLRRLPQGRRNSARYR